MTSISLAKFDSDGYPSCERHGAMNCVNRERTIWRCTTCHIGMDILNVLRFAQNELYGKSII